MSVPVCGELTHAGAARWHSMAVLSLSLALAGTLGYLFIVVPILTFHSKAWRNHERQALSE